MDGVLWDAAGCQAGAGAQYLTLEVSSLPPWHLHLQWQWQGQWEGRAAVRHSGRCCQGRPAGPLTGCWGKIEGQQQAVALPWQETLAAPHRFMRDCVVGNLIATAVKIFDCLTVCRVEAQMCYSQAQ